MKILHTLPLILGSLLATANAETYRLKFPTTVDILEDGKAVGQKRLKAGTLLTLDETAELHADEPIAAKKVTTSKLRPSNLSPIMFKNTQPPGGTVFRAEIDLGSSYYGPFDGKDALYWAVDIRARNADWSNGEFLYGYAKKTAPIGKQIKNALADGKSHRCHIKVVPVKDPDQKDLVTIESLEILPAAD